MAFAEEEARRLGHDHVGTGHLLLGLLREDRGAAASVLHGLGVRLAPARQLVDSIVRRDERSRGRALPLRPRAEQVVAHALDEATSPSRSPVEPEHLLLGLRREGEGIGVGVVERLGVSLDQVRRAMAEQMGRGSSRP